MLLGLADLYPAYSEQTALRGGLGGVLGDQQQPLPKDPGLVLVGLKLQ
ncbi:MAG: hypothetical protein SFU83_07455 [Meiothermus sp.]|nr:hypothetical protein [Meiothermus sp.]